MYVRVNYKNGKSRTDKFNDLQSAESYAITASSQENVKDCEILQSIKRISKQ